MTTETRVTHEASARAEARAALADLLIAYVDRAYVTAGQPGVLTVVRDMFLRMEPEALRDLAFALGLEAEARPEAEEDERRPGPGAP
ncbi:MAG TPA: hypothetical protein VLD58_07570 [Gemmatimonadales bacterium]|nr:hypothetical protein [Gemmatimonadales bacterium]